MMKIGVSNQTQFPRTQWVRLGTPLGVKLPVWAKLPRSQLCVAKVTVDPYYTGAVDVIPDTTDEPFKVSAIIKDSLGQFHLSAIINTQEYVITPKRILFNSNRLQIHLSQAVTPDGFVDLITYLYHDHPHIDFAGKFVAKNLDIAIKSFDIQLKVNYKGSGTVVMSMYELGNKAQAPGGTQVVRLYQGQLGDTQGVPFSGVLLFANQEMLSNPTGAASLTAAAQMVRPMYGAVPWPKWSLWDAASPVVTQNSINATFNHYDSKRNEWKNLVQNLGIIGPDYSPTTGDHANFGWRFLNEPVGSGSAQLAQIFTTATEREITRPGQYYEANGDYVIASKHTGWATWEGVTHYHHGISPDRLGRTHTGGTSNGKTGYDDQHTGYGPAALSVILHGDILMQEYLKQVSQTRIAGLTLPDSDGRWWVDRSGRAVCRLSLDTAFIYLATGERDIVDRTIKYFNEGVYPTWKKSWRVGEEIKPYTIKTDDGKVGPGTWCMVWEDLLAAIAADGLGDVAVELGIDVSKLSEFADEVSKWGAKHGYYPAGNQLVSQMNLTNGNTPPDYNSDSVRSAAGTDYKSWCQGAVIIAKRFAKARNDTAMITRCDQILTALGAVPIQWGGVE